VDRVLPAAEVDGQGRVEDDEEDEGGDGEEEVIVVDGEGEVEMGDGGVM
jgi:hypothetical protein